MGAIYSFFLDLAPSVPFSSWDGVLNLFAASLLVFIRKSHELKVYQKGKDNAQCQVSVAIEAFPLIVNSLRPTEFDELV